MINKGDKVTVKGKIAVVMDILTYAVSGEVTGYYVTFLKKDGTIGKRSGFFFIDEVKASS